jgi:alkanesulfonate monooxygenase SsuD/methylene tetrahydromethanopterin reductase-like flavin-dependent oxidoreductase (luciferase family)
MMLESIEIMLNCWKEGGPRDFNGEFWNVRRATSLDDPDNYAWHLKPYKSLDDRIALAGFSAKSHSLSVAGERGWIPLSWSVSKEFADTQWAVLTEAAEKAGKPADRSRWRQVQMIYVAETDAEARKAVVEGFAGVFWDKYWDPIFRKTGVMDFLQRRVGDPNANLKPADLIDRGIWCVGTPDRVTQRLQEQIDAYGGFGTLLQVGFDYSGAGAAGWMRNMELLAKEVMPRLKSDVAGPALVSA